MPPEEEEKHGILLITCYLPSVLILRDSTTLVARTVL